MLIQSHCIVPLVLVRFVVKNHYCVLLSLVNFLVRAAGVGPALTAWKAAVIPLDHARRTGIESIPRFYFQENILDANKVIQELELQHFRSYIRLTSTCFLISNQFLHTWGLLVLLVLRCSSLQIPTPQVIFEILSRATPQRAQLKP